MREKTRPSSPALTAAVVGREPGKAHSSQKRDRWGIGSSRTPSERDAALTTAGRWPSGTRVRRLTYRAEG